MNSNNKASDLSAKVESLEAENLKLLAENNDLKDEIAKLRVEITNLKKENSTNSINGIKDEILSSKIKMEDYIRCVKLKKLLCEANQHLVYTLRKAECFRKGREWEKSLLVEPLIPEGEEKNFKKNKVSLKRKDIFLLDTAMLCLWLQKLKLDTTYSIKAIKPISDFLHEEKYISEVKYIEYFLKMKEILPELSVMSWDAVLAYSPFPKADLIDKTIFECINFSQKIETAFGPTGKKNKLLISYIDILFTEFTDQHPAVQLMISTAKKQYLEFGDNMKYVIIFCAELLREVRQFINLNLSCLEIMNGYQLALEKVLKLLPALSCYQIKNFTDKDDNLKVLKSCVTFGNNGKDIFFKKLLADACISILNEEICFDADNIEISRIPDSDFSNLKIVPKSSRIVVEGFRHYDTHDIRRAVVTGVKTFLAAHKDGRFLPGAGATEVEVAQKLLTSNKEESNFNDSLTCDSLVGGLLKIPITLIENIGLYADPILWGVLVQKHVKGETNLGVDITGENLYLDSLKSEIFDNYLSKRSALINGVTCACEIIKTFS